MAKLIIIGNTSQLRKIQKAQRSLVARSIVSCFLEEDNKEQESSVSSPVSETLPEVEQINEEVEAKEESVIEDQAQVDEVEETKVEEKQVEQPEIKQQVPASPKVEKPKSKGRPKVKK